MSDLTKKVLSNRSNRQLLAMLADSILLPLALWLAFSLRFANFFQWDYLLPAFSIFLVLPLIGPFILYKVGLYREVVRYFGQRTVWIVMYGVGIITLTIYATAFLLQIDFFPRSVPINFALIATALLVAMRLAVRNYYHHRFGRSGIKTKVLIYGAGSAGVQLAASIGQSSEYKVVAFVDDAPALKNARVSGKKVYSPDSLSSLIKQRGIQQIFLALPSAMIEQRQQILDLLSPFDVRVLTVPSMPEILQGKSLDALSEVGTDTLLNRQSVAPISSLWEESVKEKNILVTGAGGSIGSEISRQVASNGANTLILFDSSEFALYQIEQELSATEATARIIPILGNVLDQSRLDRIIKKYSVQTIYHAAAYKHVPIVEQNIVEGIRNNALGTQLVAELALENEVERFVLISTDKAVRPTNVMGATKRLAELFIQDISKRSSKTKFGMVRFGNVLGSSGSVVPVFLKQIRSGGPVTVTHAEITRYFMTIPEAASLVIQAGSMAQGGDVFVLDMGKPVKIVDLARRMIQLSGKSVKESNQTDGDIEIQITGLRPGEKLYEELLIGENVTTTEHPKIMRAHEASLSSEEIQAIDKKLRCLASEQDANGIKQLLKTVISEFDSPYEDVDWLQPSSLEN